MASWIDSDNFSGKSKEQIHSIANQPIFLHWVLWFIPYLSVVTSILSGVLIRNWRPWLLGNLIAFICGLLGGASGDNSLIVLGVFAGSGVGAALVHQNIIEAREHLRKEIRENPPTYQEPKARKYISKRSVVNRNNNLSNSGNDSQDKSFNPDSERKFNPRKEKKIDLNLSDFKFSTPIDSNPDEVYIALKDLFYSTEEGKVVFENLAIDSFEFNKSLLGGIEFITYDDLDNEILILSSEEKNNKLIWAYSS